MTSEEIVKSLRCCAIYNGVLCNELGCKLVDKGTGVCRDILEFTAANLIERLEKEKAALIEAANPRKLCAICKNDSYYFDARCDGNTCDDCWQYKDCPCADCLSHPEWEWKGVEEQTWNDAQ